ncbi:MAG: carboxypeptidase regulatory-like domain-containing protein, partial [Acidobacteriia bacterium]|nr:carboxypeptidase regulatory-like domain-containing protein [Terriglobia bacterium]
MRIRSLYVLGVAVLAIAGYLFTAKQQLSAQPNVSVKIGPSSIGGVVTSSKGPEAGVWVIAETTDLPTRYIKEVVTDDSGRFVVPDLPKAKYTVWSRGYGLMDSPKVSTEVGKLVTLSPKPAPDAKTAAQLYPGNYWYSLMKVPAPTEFPGTGESGNGINPNIKTQDQWLHLIKTDSCESCHQLGNQYTRTIPALFSKLDSPAQQWMRRVQSGQAGNAMVGGLSQLGP